MTTIPSSQWPGHNEVEETTPCLGPFLNSGAKIFLEPRGSQLYIHWHAQTAAELLLAIEQAQQTLCSNGFSLYIEFVPAEFEDELLAAGFHPHSEYLDAWIRDLDSIDLTTPGRWTVRPILPEDYYTAAVITRACAGASRGFSGETAEWAAEWLSEPGRAAFLVSEGDMALGVVFTGLYHSASRNTEVCWVRELAVIPEAQGKGVGRELTLAALRWGREHGAGLSFLAVDRENVNAIHLYESIGYRLNEGRGQINMIKSPVKIANPGEG